MYVFGKLGKQIFPFFLMIKHIVFIKAAVWIILFLTCRSVHMFPFWNKNDFSQVQNLEEKLF